ncbi:hypothetical protein, partial [Burkholderia cepacia]
VIRSVAAIAASGAGQPAAGQLTRPESGHFYVAKSGHFNLATTESKNDHQHYVKFEEHPSKHVFSRRKQISIAPNAQFRSIAPNAQFRKADCICALIVFALRENLDAMSDTDTPARYQRSIPVRHLRIGHAGRGT